MYKTKLPFTLLFNKVDIMPCNFINDWMENIDSFSLAIQGRSLEKDIGNKKIKSNISSLSSSSSDAPSVSDPTCSLEKEEDVVSDDKEENFFIRNENPSSYMDSLISSMSLVLEEFYSVIPSQGFIYLFFFLIIYAFLYLFFIYWFFLFIYILL
jgi:Ca2+-dependent lipid-binding protein